MPVPKLKTADIREKLLIGDQFLSRRALKELGVLERQTPGDPEVYELKGMAYGNLRKCAEAAKYYHIAYECSGGSEVYLSLFAQMLLYTERAEEGLHILEAMTKRRLPFPEIYIGLAAFYRNQAAFGNNEDGIPKALDTIELALTIPQLVAEYKQLRLIEACVYLAGNEHDFAKESALAAMRMMFKKDFSSFSDVPIEPAIKQIEQLDFFLQNECVLQQISDAIRGWSEETEDDESQLVTDDDELRARLDKAINIDWYSITPDMLMSVEEAQSRRRAALKARRSNQDD